MAIALKGGEAPSGIECVAERPDGTRFWFTPYPVIQRDDQGRIIGGMNLLFDITDRKNAEREALDALRQQRLITDNMEIGVTRCTRDRRYLWVSRAFAGWLGQMPEEIAGRSMLDVIGQEAYESKRPYIDTVLSGQTTEFETQIALPEVGTRWIHAVYVPTKDQNQEVDGWIAVIADVTDRRKAEEQLRESEERFRTLANAAPAMIWLCGADKLCTFVNKSWLDFTGRSLEHELGNGWISTIQPDDLDHCFATYLPAFDGRRDFQMEYRVRRFDGEYRWVLNNGKPHFRDGDFIGYIGSCTDITEQKLFEERLRASTVQLLEAQRLAKVGSWEREIDTGRSQWSEEIYRIFGLPNDAERGLSAFINFVHPEDREKVLETERQVYSTNAPIETEYRIIRPNGEMRYLRSVIEAIRNDQGEPTRLVGATEDITDAKRAEEESLSRRKLESVGTLASGIAHDFNNLLSSALAQAELGLAELKEGLSPEEELKAIRDVAIRGSEIVRQLMTFSGKATAGLELVDLSTIVSDMLELLKISVSKHVVLEPNLANDLPAVRANPAQLRQIVLNLVINASEAIGTRRGVIRITTRYAEDGQESSRGANDFSASDYVELGVSDNGDGMPPELQARAFDPFFTTKPAGHGLGLATVDGIVRSLCGKVHLASELGKGTTFRILLPCE
jgi:PAS domain S-box-containing protein